MFDKTRCINNIYALAKERGVKIGDMEEKAGMSKGYLSRVSKPDYQGSPSIEMLDSIASQLGVGIDFLVNYSTDTLSENEQFVMKFIDRLIQQTLAGKLEWQMETAANLNGDDASKVENPLVTVTKNYSPEADEWYYTHVYGSGIHEGGATICGTCYYAQLSTTQAKVFLNKVTYHNVKTDEPYRDYEHNVIEVYLYEQTVQTVQPVCSTFYVVEELKKMVCNLYQAAASVPSKIGLSPSARSTMEFFMRYGDKQ